MKEVALPLPVLQSPVLRGFHHGFTSRAGGVSEGAYASLNLGLKWGDAPERVAENRRRLLEAAGRPLYFATQVHGATVHVVQAEDALETVAGRQADALVARGPVAVGVHVADCGPILLADPRTGAFGAAHAGWRGTVAGVVSAAVDALVADLGCRADELRVAIGPCIRVCCFEVGPEVVDAVRRAWPWAEAEGVIDLTRPKAHVDLPRLNLVQAMRRGVPSSQIDAGDLCTVCAPGRFFSYRRDGGRTGLHAAFITGA